MKKPSLRISDSALLVFILLVGTFIVLYESGQAFSGFSTTTNASWFNTSWHYRIRVDINSTAVNRTDWPIEIMINFSDQVPSGTFDNNSLRVFEYNSTGSLLHEPPSQFDKDDDYNNATNAIGEVVFIMNGTTPANTKRIFYIYYDTFEFGSKTAPTYSTSLTSVWDGQVARINTTKLDTRIDTNRGSNLSGIYFVENRDTQVPVVTGAAGQKPAEYLEYHNGTHNTSFDLIGNATIIMGPVRITVKQEGHEVVMGGTQRTNIGRVVKKYYFYNRAGLQAQGAFVKLSQEFFLNATIERSSNFTGAPALDLRRTFLAADISSQDRNANDPYSWAWATDSGGSAAGIINANETAVNYTAGNDTALGRIGISFLSSTIPANTSVRQVSVLYFGTGGSDAVSEFISVINGTTTLLTISLTQPEKWSVITTASINATMFNRNETLFIRGNLTNGDPYNLTKTMNATLDLGTAGAGDDVTIVLFDDGTNGDAAAGDRIFSNNYTFSLSSEVGEWRMNLSAFDNATKFLNSTIFVFNVTNVYFVNITMENPLGLTSRQVIANVTVKTFSQNTGITAAMPDCSANGVPVTNKTELGNGIYAINFSAPSTVGTFDLFCNTTKHNNTGNDTKQFQTEPTKTTVRISTIPVVPNATGVGIYANGTLLLTGNATNNGSGVARNTNITLELLTGWTSNISLANCGDININISCLRGFNITVPNNTAPGNYTINVTAVWANADGTGDSARVNVNVTVLANPLVDINETIVTGGGADGTTKSVGFFTVLSVGNSNLTNAVFNCTSGPLCQNFNISFSPINISNLGIGQAAQVSVLATIPLDYAPGTYNGTINASSGPTSDTVFFIVTLTNTTNLSVTTIPVSTTLGNVTALSNATVLFTTNATNIGNRTAKDANVTYVVPPGWVINSSFELCGNLTGAQSCLRQSNVTVPNGTLAGNYSVNITARWRNFDNSSGIVLYQFNISVGLNPVIDVANDTLSGTAADGNTSNPFNITILSVGSSNLSNVTFSCVSGAVCTNFTLLFLPNNISNLGVGSNLTVVINVTVPPIFQAGVYTGSLDAIAQNDGTKSVSLSVTVPSSRRWNMTPVFCQKNENPVEGKVCDVNITNTGNDAINFTITGVVINKTSVNATNFTLQKNTTFSFGVFYNITGFVQVVYNSTYLVSALQSATPQNATLNITLLPFTPPTIIIEMVNLSDQTNNISIIANVTDNTNSGIVFVNGSITRPDSTVDLVNFTLISQAGNFTRWRVFYGNATGNTTLRGRYNVSVFAGDTIGNVGNASANLTLRIRLNIASNTLGTQYFQGDTGTIFYSARNISNTGVDGINATFEIRGPGGTFIFGTNRVTNTDGSFVPLSTFSLTSDTTTGNYTLITNSTYYDLVVNLTFTIQQNYSFRVDAKTVTVTGLFADIETAVVWFPNNVMRFNILVYDGEGKTVDPTSLNLTVFDPAQNLYFTTSLPSMTKQGTGFYSFSFAMPTSTATGMYLAVANITKDTLSTMKLKAFRVAQGGPYDVRLTLLKSEVEQGLPADFTITVENKGEVTQDVFIDYTVTSTSTGIVYYTASEAVLTPAFTNQTFTRSALTFSTQPLGTYRLNAVVKYDNTQPAINASTTFTLIARKFTATPPPPPSTPAAGAGGTGFVTVGGEPPSIVRSMIIEKYNDNIKLSPGFKRIEYVVVTNSGKANLQNISLNLLGVPSSWFNITPSSYSQLAISNSTVFVIEFSIPQDADIKDYKANLIATSSTTSDQKSVTISILRSISDLILEEINKLKRDLRDLLLDIGAARAEGKNVEGVIAIADKADDSIKNAEFNYNLNNTETAFNDITDARILIEKAKDLLRTLISEGKPLDVFWIIVIAFIVSGAAGTFLVLKRRNAIPKQIPETISHFAHIIEKIRGTPDKAVLEKDKDKITRMLSVLENEKKEGIVSDSAYTEMKRTLESRLDRISRKLVKARD